MPRTLYVSPHLDDAVLSCGGGILERARTGTRVLVATVFSHGTEESHAHRRAEDARALAAAGAEAVYLGLLDAPFRGVDGTFEGLTGTAPDPAIVERVRTRVRELVGELDPDEVWLPAGIGGHVDHQSVFEARDAAGERARLYADRPYAFVEPLVRLRRCELEGTSADVSEDELRDAIERAGVMGAFLAPSVPTLRARLATARTPTGLRIQIRAHRFPRSGLAAACALVDAYASQLGSLFGARASLSTYSRLATDGDAWLEHEVVVRSSR